MPQSPEQRFHADLIEALPRLRRLALALTRNRHAAEDLVQDTVMRALAAKDSFVLGSNFHGWLYRILRNRCISIARRQRETADVDDLPIAVGANHEARLVLKELVKALGELRADARSALLLTALEGMSCEEAATVLHCASGTVKSRVNRARRQLQMALQGELPAPGRRRQGGRTAHLPPVRAEAPRQGATA